MQFPTNMAAREENLEAEGNQIIRFSPLNNGSGCGGREICHSLSCLIIKIQANYSKSKDSLLVMFHQLPYAYTFGSSILKLQVLPVILH